MKRLLDSLDHKDRFRPPLDIEHRDQLTPDFVLSTGDTKVGVETTRSTDQELFRADKIHLGEYPDELIHTVGLTDRGFRRSNQQIIETMFPGDEPPVECLAEAMFHKASKIGEAIARKRMKLASPHFERFDRNWLVIFDDSHFVSDRFSRVALIDELQKVLAESSEFGIDFDEYYIFCGQISLRWRQRTLSWKFHANAG